MNRADRIAECVRRLQAPGLSIYSLRRIENTLGIDSQLDDHSEDAGRPWRKNDQQG